MKVIIMRGNENHGLSSLCWTSNCCIISRLIYMVGNTNDMFLFIIMMVVARLEIPVLDVYRTRVSFVLMYEVAIPCLRDLDLQVCREELPEVF